MTVKFYKIGSLFKSVPDEETYALCLISSDKAMLIGKNSSNRWIDDQFDKVSNKQGVFGCLLDEKIFGEKFFSIEDFVSKKTSKPKNPKKPPTISFTRYIRPYSSSAMHSFFTDLDHDRGVALAYKLDYKNGLIYVGVSVCKGDKFVKSVGREIAEKRLRLIENSKVNKQQLHNGYGYIIQMPENKTIDQHGVNGMFARHIRNLPVKSMNREQNHAIDSILDQLEDAFIPY